ncbi:MAG: VWA domain-containing protein [Deltaproteobacteria bacterium]|nr:VWA domain-containing protein [Deltaproteobacteria bacterium]
MTGNPGIYRICLFTFFAVLANLFIVSGCGTDNAESSKPAGNLSAESDADSDSDSDSDADADGNNVDSAAHDIPLDTSSVSDADADTDSDSDTDSDTDTDTDADADNAQDTDASEPADTASSPSDTDSAANDTTDTATEDTVLTCDPTAQITYWMSADDSNSMASPVIVRNQIESGSWVTTTIRPWEFLNYYTFNYQPAEQGTLNIFSDLRIARETESGAYSMQIAVSSPAITNATRRPMNIVLAVDTSGSMAGGPMDRLRQVCRGIAANLKDGDIVSIVEWDTAIDVVLKSYQVVSANDPALLTVINDLREGGGTNLYGGLTNAYTIARADFDPNRINRVVLISDGVANAGVQELSLISQMSADSEEEGILLAGVGTGDGYNDTLMDDVTDAGKGAYIYIDTTEEADRMFANEINFLANMEIAARDVQVSVTMPPGFYVEEFHGEEISTVKAEVDPQHLAYNDAMIFHQLINTCGDLVTTGAEEFTVTATFQDPLTRQPKSASKIFTLSQLLDGTTTQMLKGDAIIHYALAIEEIQTIYRTGNNEAIRTIIDDALSEVDAAALALGNDPELLEISELLTAYRAVFE